MAALIGKKIGMSQVFDDKGSLTPITIIEAGPCLVISKTDNKVKLGYGQVNEKRFKKPLAGFFKKNGLTPKKLIKEFKITKEQSFQVGQELKADVFKPGDYLDIVGISKGKGFKGGIKRWGWNGGPESHGSMSHRRPGSIGSNTTPGRTFKGHRMPGHTGAAQITVQNLRVIRVQPEHNLLAVRGAVPGFNNSILILKTALKLPFGKKEVVEVQGEKQQDKKAKQAKPKK